jgi:hypothetical protein
LLGELNRYAFLTGGPIVDGCDALRHFGLTSTATAAEVRRAFRKLALQQHPDRGGDAERFRTTKTYYDLALAFCEHRGAGR